MLRSLAIAFIACLVFSPTLCRGETSNYRGAHTFRTPYDTKYRKIETYLITIREMIHGFGSPSFLTQQSRIRRYLKMARSFKFEEEGLLSSGIQQDNWQLPEETERLGSGDCEDLAIWLYCQLLDEGFSNIRFTLGLAGGENKTMHAWVTWYEKGKTYILDPSRTGGIYRSSQSGPITYHPYYSYYLDEKWHHR